MTRAARIAPLRLEDFASKAAPAQTTPPPPTTAWPQARFTQDDIDAARAAGVAEGIDAGKAQSVCDATAETAERLRDMIAGLGDERARQSAAMRRDSDGLRAALRAFLVALCGRLAAARAGELALALVDRLVASSVDGASTTLFVSAETLAALGADLRRELAARPEAAFIALAADGALSGGACRLAWRGGGAAFSADTIVAEIDRILAAPAQEDNHE